MKLKRILLWTFISFFCYLFIYAIAAATQHSTSIISIVATKITIVTTFPAYLFKRATGIKLSGRHLTVNFIIVSVLSALIIDKIKNRNKIMQEDVTHNDELK